MICIICHDKILNEFEILKCKHVFHKHCIKEWFEAQKNINQVSSCPLCRQEQITIKDRLHHIMNLQHIDYVDIILYISLLSCVSYTCSLLYSSYQYFNNIVNIIT